MLSAVRRVRGVVGARLDLLRARHEAGANTIELRHSIDELRRAISELQELQRQDALELRAAIAGLRDLQVKQLRLGRAGYDDIGRLREKLIALRRSEVYEATFENRRPLISVPIATYNASELLVDRALASVRAQTYDHWEVVVVGDGCTDDTEARVNEIGDARIRFVNLPFRTLIHDDPMDRWWVSGVAPMNRAIELSHGEWIAPLDDDDEFLPTHMEALLELALERRAEFAYGTIEQVRDGGEDVDALFAFPPEHGTIGMQATLYLRALDFFAWDVHSWAMEEPADWNLIRRMRETGVHMAATEAPVVRYYPSLRERV